MNYNYKVFGQTIQTEREIKKLTIEQLAAKLGITEQTMTAIEDGNLDVDSGIVLKAMDILEIPAWNIGVIHTGTAKDIALKRELMSYIDTIGAERLLELVKSYKNEHNKKR